eukprot:TCONS_00036731-protein
MNFGSGLRIKKHEDREQLLEDVPEIVLNPELNLHQNQQPGDKYEPKPEITQLQPDTLLITASKRICKEIVQSGLSIDSLNISRQTKDVIYQSMENFNFCYNCKKGLHPIYESNKCSIYLEQFLGLTSIPVYCYSCDSCLDEVKEMLYKLEKDAADSVEVETTVYVNKEVCIRKLHRKNCRRCGGRVSRINRFMRSLKCR